MSRQDKLYRRAGNLAYIIMGKNKHGESNAVNDPLAWWELVELLMNFRSYKP